MDFNYLKWREKKSQAFDKDKIFIEQAGVKKNNYDLIQAAREDTEVIPTLEKYGCIDRMILDVEDIYGEFGKYKNLREIQEQQIQAEKMWQKLPIETRREFNHDKYNFVKNGEKWLKNKIEEAKNAQTTTTQQQEVSAPDTATKGSNE